MRNAIENRYTCELVERNMAKEIVSCIFLKRQAILKLWFIHIHVVRVYARA